MRSRGRLRIQLSGAVIVVVLALATAGTVNGWLGGIRQQLIDVQYPTGSIDERILVVELPLCSRVVDSAVELDAAPPPEADLCETYEGRPRSLHAAVVRALAGAEVVAYDVVFDEFDPEHEDDRDLEAALRQAGNVVLGLASGLRGQPGEVPVLVDPTLPAPAYAEAARAVAHTSVLVDPLDGVIRRVPLVVDDGRRFVPSLAFAAVSLAEDADPGAITILAERDVQVGSRRITTDGQRLLEVNWSWSWSPPPAEGADRLDGLRVTAEDVLAGRVDAEGRTVFVGVADPLVDWRETSVNKAGAPGVHVHANAANTMFTNLFRTGPKATTALLGTFVMVLVVAGGGVALGRLRWLPAVSLALLVAWQAVVNLRHQYGEAVDNLWPNLAVLLAAGGVTGVWYLTEFRQRQRVAGLFKEYVPDAVADELMASEQIVDALSGQRVDVTVLFCDLRGFTRTAADLDPPVVRQLLEIYYDELTRIIHGFGGTVMQFVGDEVFAVFGAPLDQPDHPQRALDCALAMQEAADRVNATLEGQGVRIAWGIGLNTGTVVSAIVGSAVHKQYAVVGNTVNVGARLCSLATPGGVVASIHTIERLEQVPELEELPPMPLKGVQEDPRPHRVVLPEQAPSGPLAQPV